MNITYILCGGGGGAKFFILVQKGGNIDGCLMSLLYLGCIFFSMAFIFLDFVFTDPQFPLEVGLVIRSLIMK